MMYEAHESGHDAGAGGSCGAWTLANVKPSEPGRCLSALMTSNALAADEQSGRDIASHVFRGDDGMSLRIDSQNKRSTGSQNPAHSPLVSTRDGASPTLAEQPCGLQQEISNAKVPMFRRPTLASSCLRRKH